MRLLLSFALAFTVVSQILVFGPLDIVAGNPDIPLAPTAILGWPLMVALGMAVLVGGLLWFATKVWTMRVLSLFAALGISLYLTYYGFAPDMGPLDGHEIRFSDYIVRGAIEIVVLASVFAAALFFKPIRVAPALSVALIIFSIANGTQVVWKSDWQEESPPAIQEASARDLTAQTYLRTASGRTLGAAELSERNVIVIVLDTLQNDVFEHLVNADTKLRQAFSGFTLYRNATGFFPFTQLSIPVILTGEAYGNDEPIPKYMARASQKNLPALMAESGYAVDLIPLHSRTDYLDSVGAHCRMYGSVWDLYLLRQTPVLLKPYIYNDGRFLLASLCTGNAPTTEQERDLAVFDKLINNAQKTRADPSFKFLHFWGMHPPARLDANCKAIETSHDLLAAQQQAACLLSKTAAYLNKLRDLGVYKESRIFLVADHGSLFGLLSGQVSAPGSPSYVISSAHPTIAFKDFGSTGDLAFSNAPVTSADIYPTAIEDIVHKDHGPTLLDIPENKRRDRHFLYFKSAEEASHEKLEQAQLFFIRGDVRNPKSWSAGAIQGRELPQLSVVDFGTRDALKFVDLAFSVEAEGVGGSWIISRPAVVTGLIPQASRMSIKARMLSAHPNQSIRVRLNDRYVATWNIDEVNKWSEHEIVVDVSPDEVGIRGRMEIEVSKIASPENGTRPLGVFVDWIAFKDVGNTLR